MKEKLGANQIVDLLSRRHKEDVFIPECKNGSSSNGHCRMDAWAMVKSWSNPRSYAYEVKVSRSDFIGDNKWQSYLPYCNELYFVCPHGLIVPEEVPDPCGLIYASKNGAMLQTKKKAGYRAVQIPESLYRYVLMARIKVTRDYSGDNYEYDANAYWKSWLEDRDASKTLGERVRQKVAERVAKMETEVLKMKKEVERCEAVKQKLKELGVDTRYGFPDTWSLERTLKTFDQSVPETMLRTLANLKRDIGSAEMQFNNLRVELSERLKTLNAAPENASLPITALDSCG